MKTWVVTAALTSLAIPSAFVNADVGTPVVSRGAIRSMRVATEAQSAWSAEAFQRRISPDGVITLAPQGNGPQQISLPDYRRRLIDAFQKVHEHLLVEERIRSTVAPNNQGEAIQAVRQSALRELSTMRLPPAPLAGAPQGLGTRDGTLNEVYRLEHFLARARAHLYANLSTPNSARDFGSVLKRAGELASWSARSPRSVVGATALGAAVAVGVVAGPTGAQASSLTGGQPGASNPGAQQARQAYDDGDFGGSPEALQ